jgi:uncharacterized protein YggE
MTGLWAAIAVAVSNAAALAQPFVQPGRGPDIKDGPPTITTTATAKVKVKPDTVRISFGVYTPQSNVKEARKENDRHAKQILEALQALKIPELKIATTNDNMEAVIFHDENQPVNQPAVPAVLGFRVAQTFVVTAQGDDVARLREIARKVVDAAVENGANTAPAGNDRDEMMMMRFRMGRFPGGGGGQLSVGPRVDYFKEDVTEARRQALTKAAEEALARAKALARGAEVKVREISDDADGYAERYEAYYRSQGMPPEHTLEEGADHYLILCRVRVVCTY